MRIEFKAKTQTMYDMEDSPLYTFVVVPEFKRTHVDMNAARKHPKHGGYANSDLFPSMLARIRKEILDGHAYLRLDSLPDNVSIDTSGFLAKITIEVA
jgi:hypothetical protein